jgi:endonuclease YncB( thermonuclease family)
MSPPPIAGRREPKRASSRRSTSAVDRAPVFANNGRVPIDQPPAIVCQRPRAIDGDTIRCRGRAQSIRLAGIDAPELPGHCRQGRQCAPGDGRTSKRALAKLLASGKVTVRLEGGGGFGRARGHVWAGSLDVNCVMVERGFAVRRYGDIGCR